MEIAVALDFDYYGIEGIADISLLQTEGGVYIAPFPTLDGGYCARVNLALGIRANSINQLNAYRFINIALSDEILGTLDASPVGIPVRINSLHKRLQMERDRFNVSTGHNYRDGRSYSTINDELMARFTDVLSNPTSAFIWNEQRVDIYYKCFTPFFEDNKPFEECFAELESQLQLYISE